jgi:hypothetical protein
VETSRVRRAAATSRPAVAAALVLSGAGTASAGRPSSPPAPSARTTRSRRNADALPEPGKECRARDDRSRTCAVTSRARTIEVEVWDVLSESERRSWDEIEQRWVEDTRVGTGVVVLAIGAAGIALMFAVVGALWVGLVVLAVPVLVWFMSRHWQQIGAAWAATLVPMDGSAGQPEEPRRTSEAS